MTAPVPKNQYFNIQPKVEALGEGLGKSFILRNLPFVALLITGSVLLAFNPVGWTAVLITMVAVAAFTLLMNVAMVVLHQDARNQLFFELGAIKRLFTTNDSEIRHAHHTHKLFLGALPNGLKFEGERLVREKEVNSVLSMNEPWERRPLGLSLPYSATDWGTLGVKYKGMDVEDHAILTTGQLDEGAEYIRAELDAGRNLYVHCKAGQGRSAMIVAAYLMKYCNMTVDEAIARILADRPNSTIAKKRQGLESYSATLPRASGEKREHLG